MFKKRKIEILVLVAMILILNSPEVFAQNVQTIEQASSNFSDKMLALFKGPIVKISACLVLFMAVGSLLRGRHQTALSCGIAFVLLLMLPVVLGYFGAR